MKEQPQLFIDQRGTEYRALLTESKRVIAHGTFPKKPDDKKAVKSMIETLSSAAGVRPGQVHVLISEASIETSTYQLQEMPVADVEKIIQRSLVAKTGEQTPLFRVTQLSPQQDKEVFVSEFIASNNYHHLKNIFEENEVKLGSVSTTLQSILTAFAPFQNEILQSQAIFDISQSAVTAVFMAPTGILFFVTESIEEPETESFPEPSENDRELKRQLFVILNVIHGIYSQYMRANPHSPVEKVWVCGAGSAIPELEKSLHEAMDIDVATLDLLAGQVEPSCDYTPMAALIDAVDQPGFVNFVPVKTVKSRQFNDQAKILVAAGIITCLLLAAGLFSQFGVWELEKTLKKKSLELQYLEAAASAAKGRIDSLHFMKKQSETRIPFYEIFGKIADTLPREVQLDLINYEQEGEERSLEIGAVMRNKTPWRNKEIFTSVINSLDNTDALDCTRAPDMSVLKTENSKLIKVNISCQVSADSGRVNR